MSRLRQRFYLSPLVLARGHLRPVVDLYDVAWNCLADAGNLRLIQTFATPDAVAKMDRDVRLNPVTGDAFALLQELTHRPGGADLLREALGRTSDLAAAARDALARAPLPEPSLHGDRDAHPADRRPARPAGPR